MSNDERLMGAMTELSLALLTERSLKSDLDRLVRIVCQLVDGCSGASVSMLVDGEPTTVAVTDRIALQLDMLQYEADDGPCVRALTGENIRVGYLPNEQAFPHFAIGAADRRVLSVLSTPSIDHGSVVGSLNLYSQRRDGFGNRDRDVAAVFAAEVAHALVKSSIFGKARTIREKLQEELDESTLVARAEGFLMAVNDCSAAQARDLIRLAAEDNGERIIVTVERILTMMRSGDLTVEQ